MALCMVTCGRCEGRRVESDRFGVPVSPLEPEFVRYGPTPARDPYGRLPMPNVPRYDCDGSGLVLSTTFLRDGK